MPHAPRKEIRVPVDGSIVYSVGFATQGGHVKDISMQGCLVESDHPPHPASMLSFRMLLPGLNEPLEVQLALVQWVLGNHFGLKIVDMFADTQKRLRRFLDDNYVQLARARRGRAKSQTGSPRLPQSAIVRPPLDSTAAASPLQGGLALPDPGPRTVTNCLEDPVAILPQDLSAFVCWMLDARHAFEEKEPLPTPPLLEFEEFKACTQFIQTLLGQAESAQSRSAEPPCRKDSQQEDIAHLLTQLNTDDHMALRSALSQLVDAQQGFEHRSPDRDQPAAIEDRAERRVRVRRSTLRDNQPSRVPLSVRLAQLTAKFKLPSWIPKV